MTSAVAAASIASGVMAASASQTGLPTPFNSVKARTSAATKPTASFQPKGIPMDICDAAQDIIEANTARAVAFRKPVPTTCEDCDEPCAVLPNGARARFCETCLMAFQAAA